MSVFCLAIDHDGTLLGEIFEVFLDTGSRITSLKMKAMECLRPIIDQDTVAVLTVHCSAGIQPEMSRDDLARAVSQLDLAKTNIPPFTVVADVVSDPLKMLLLIKRPARKALKRPRSPSVSIDHKDLFRRSRLFTATSFAAAKSLAYKDSQCQTDQSLLDDRPKSELNVAPIALLYNPFGRFDDIVSGREDLHAELGIDLPALKQGVDDLATAMLRLYESEGARHEAALPLFGKIGFSLRPSKVGGTTVQTSGDSQVEGFMDNVMEIKTELHGINAIPYFRCTLYVGKGLNNVIHQELEREIRRHWRIPALCITLAGQHIQFHGTILLGPRYHTVSLTQALSFCPSSANGGDRKLLYVAFAAALLLQKCIQDDFNAYLNASRQSLPIAVLSNDEYLLPAVSKILKYGCNPANEEHIEFKILGHHHHRQASRRHLYVAQVTMGASEGLEIIVKFSRSYCADLHNHCFEQGNAPKLLGFQRLPGGWYAIAMEYLSHTEGIAMLPFSDYWRDTPWDWTTALAHCEKVLTELVDGFHEKGLVHGDLRGANILCDESGKTIWLIDFDWGGCDGKVQYPTWDLNEDLRTGRHSKTLDISKEDDNRVLRTTLHALKDLWSN